MKEESGVFKKVVCLKVRGFPCFYFEVVDDNDVRHQVSVINVKVPRERHQGNAYTYVTNYLHAEIYFWSTRKHTEYALFRSGCSQIGYLVLYAIPPTKASLGEGYFRTSTSLEFVKSSEDFYDMDPGGA